MLRTEQKVANTFVEIKDNLNLVSKELEDIKNIRDKVSQDLNELNVLFNFMCILAGITHLVNALPSESVCSKLDYEIKTLETMLCTEQKRANTSVEIKDNLNLVSKELEDIKNIPDAVSKDLNELNVLFNFICILAGITHLVNALPSEPVCSKLDYEIKTLETMLLTEQKVANMLEEIKDNRNLVSKKLEDIKNMRDTVSKDLNELKV